MVMVAAPASRLKMALWQLVQVSHWCAPCARRSPCAPVCPRWTARCRLRGFALVGVTGIDDAAGADGLARQRGRPVDVVVVVLGSFLKMSGQLGGAPALSRPPPWPHILRNDEYLRWARCGAAGAAVVRWRPARLAGHVEQHGHHRREALQAASTSTGPRPACGAGAAKSRTFKAIRSTNIAAAHCQILTVQVTSLLHAGSSTA